MPVPERPSSLAAIVLMLAVSAASVVVAAVPASASTTLTPVADSYVDASHPADNFGGRSYVKTDASPVRTALFRFDVSGVVSVPSAVFNIYAESANTTGFALYEVDNDTWSETGVTYSNRPPEGALIRSVGPIVADTRYTVDVTDAAAAAASGDGLLSLAMVSSSGTSTTFSSRESSRSPTLITPTPPGPSPFVVSRVGSTYHADSATSGASYAGSLRTVVDEALADLHPAGGGTMTFTAGDFDLGSDHFYLRDITDVIFEGQGMGVTTVRNFTNASADTEVFDCHDCKRLTIRDMTISAGGSFRSTSDALDFDRGDDMVIERVEISASRARGVVFDGKDNEGTRSAVRNTITDCVITGVPSDGIEFLASSENVVNGCTITDVGGHGIQMTKSSTSAQQPNKKSNDNDIDGNLIVNAGEDGVNINSGDRNQISNNIIRNSSDDITGRSGIRISSTNSVACNDNEIFGNVSTDDQAAKTQRYGLNISSSRCNRTVVGNNDFSGNLTAEILDLGTGTIYSGSDTHAPDAPQNLLASSVAASEVVLSWDAALDDVGVTSYLIYRGSTPSLIATVGGATTAYADASVAPGATYTYEVRAKDAAGNLSDPSSPLIVDTPGAGTTFVLTPEADSYVYASLPSKNYGSSSNLRVDDSPLRVAYVRFDVQGASSGAASATLRVYAKSSSSAGHDVHEVADVTWDESAITFQNAPTTGAIVGSSGPFTGGAWIETDVTAQIQGDGPVTFAVTTPSGTQISYDSREGVHAPELVITPSP